MRLNKRKISSIFNEHAARAFFWEEKKIFGKKIPNPYKAFIDGVIFNLLGEIKSNEIILDVACGLGRWALPLSRRTKYYVGCDISKKSLKFVRRNLEVDVVLCDGENLPIRNESIDLVFSAHTIEHYPNIEKGLSEIHRVMKQEGRFLCITPNKYGIPELFLSLKESLFKSQKSRLAVGHISLQTPTTLDQLLKNVGLRPLRRIASTIIYPGGLDIPVIGKFLSTFPFLVLVALLNFESAVSLLNLEHKISSTKSFRKISHEIIVLSTRE